KPESRYDLPQDLFFQNKKLSNLNCWQIHASSMSPYPPQFLPVEVLYRGVGSPGQRKVHRLRRVNVDQIQGTRRHRTIAGRLTQYCFHGEWISLHRV
ncbi:unnamed protein product, partial [Brassica oleracea var. botrytis]